VLVTVNGKRWQMQFGRTPTGWYGFCDTPNQPKKRIILRPSLRKNPQLLLDTTIHEMLHAGGPILDEDFVDTMATDIARALIKIGWRLPSGPNL